VKQRSTQRSSRITQIGYALSLALGVSTLIVPACGGESTRELEREDTDATGGASSADAGEPVTCGGKRCAANERCNAWTRVCQSLEVPYPPPGQDNGGPCTTEADCRSAGSSLPGRPLCITQNSADFCVSYCELPPDVDVATTFVRSDCPEGSVCLPSSLLTQSDESVGTCVPECQSDSTCRTGDGYYCRTTYINPARTFTNGYCAPDHCKSRGCHGFVCGC
jgi:hypothetical protein